MGKYTRFILMVACGTVVMYALMYLDVYEWSHVYLSEMRAYMALIMGAAMAIVMLTFMGGMYDNRRLNAAIYGLSLLVAAGALWLARSQRTVDDRSYMRSMIPHHSIAVLTSERARITDPRVRKLADGIIESQRREILEMEALLRERPHAP